VLERLGFRDAPSPDFDGLVALYGAWCNTVPFDNVVKRIHLATGSPAPLPNGEPEVFFDLYLRHGTSGTCWPSTLALYALVSTLGFDVRLGSASMHDDVAGRVHTHGTLLVDCDGRDYWVDTSMLSERPIPLQRGEETRLDHPFRPVRAEPVDDLWRIHWWRQAFPDEIGCLLLDDDVTIEHCLARYEASRKESPFNTALHTCTMRGGRGLAVAFGHRCEHDATGPRSAPLGDDRTRVLVEEFGYSEEIVARMPPDET
jgi:N-hydroxyarylamine O-acetyltransferase